MEQTTIMTMIEMPDSVQTMEGSSTEVSLLVLGDLLLVVTRGRFSGGW